MSPANGIVVLQMRCAAQRCKKEREAKCNFCLFVERPSNDFAQVHFARENACGNNGFDDKSDCQEKVEHPGFENAGEYDCICCGILVRVEE